MKKRSILLGLAMPLMAMSLLMVSCKDDVAPDYDRQETQGQRSTSMITLDAYASEATEDAQLIEDAGEEEVRAFRFDLLDNDAKPYPKPKIALTDGQQIPVVIVLRKEGRNAVVTRANWTWQQGGAGKKQGLIADGISLSGIDNEFANKSQDEGWKMFCVVGGEWDEQNKKIGFNAQTDGPKTTGHSAEINAIYMSESWVPVKVSRPQGKSVRLEAPSVRLKNKTITLFLSATNKVGDSRYFRGFSIDSERLSFRGEFALSNLALDAQPAYAPTGDWTHRTYDAISGVGSDGHATHQVANDDRTGFFVTCAVPMANDLNPMKVSVASVIGRDHAELGSRKAFNTEVTNAGKGIKAGDFVALHTIEVRKHKYEGSHPIEQFLRFAGSEDRLWYPSNDVSASDVNDTATERYRDEFGRAYYVPSYNEANIIFPNFRDAPKKNDFGPKRRAMIKFDESLSETIVKEQIKIWKTTPLEYNGTYKSAPGNDKIFYGLRFQGPNNAPGNPMINKSIPSPSKWLSAYRYEDMPGGVLVRVRHLGFDKRNTKLATIAKESYWNSDPGYGKREFRLFVPSGKYWTANRANRAGQNVVVVMRVKSTPDERTIPKTSVSAYVGDLQGLSHAESPRFSSDKENPYFLITRPTDPVKNRIK